MQSVLVLLLIGTLLAPVVGHAADIPVSYTVEFRTLKREAVSGSTLVFELYSDDACTSLVHAEIAAIDDVALLSRLKLVKPSGGARPPTIVEVRHLLTGVLPSAALFLRVSGPGIAASGPDCQSQVAGIAGPPGPEGVPGAQGPAGPPGPGLGGHEIVQATGSPPFSGATAATIEVQCPTGKMVVGGGFAHSNATSVSVSQPIAPDRWRARCLGAECQVTAYAICVNAP